MLLVRMMTAMLKPVEEADDDDNEHDNTRL